MGNASLSEHLVDALMFSLNCAIREGHWDFGYFLDRFFSFCTRKLRVFGFGVHYGLQIFCFRAFCFRFSSKILMNFRIWYSTSFSVFPIWVPVPLLPERQLRASSDFG